MLQEFLRLAVYVPVDEAGQGADLAAVSAAAVRKILRTFRDFGFAGSVGTYQAVVEISSAVETFMPTADSVPTHGVGRHRIGRSVRAARDLHSSRHSP